MKAKQSFFFCSLKHKNVENYLFFFQFALKNATGCIVLQLCVLWPNTSDSGSMHFYDHVDLPAVIPILSGYCLFP